MFALCFLLSMGIDVIISMSRLSCPPLLPRQGDSFFSTLHSSQRGACTLPSYHSCLRRFSGISLSSYEWRQSIHRRLHHDIEQCNADDRNCMKMAQLTTQDWI